MSPTKEGPLYQLQANAKNKRVAAEQCRKEAESSSRRADEFEREALWFEEAARKLEEAGFVDHKADQHPTPGAVREKAT